MNNQSISTRPPSPGEALLRERFTDEITGQPERLDALARQLLTLELAIPGLYATVLKLIQGKEATLTGGFSLYMTFGCWLFALLLTLIGLFPRRYAVDPSIIRRTEPAEEGQMMSVEAFFMESARYKYRLLGCAAAFFFAGVISAIWELL
ncbi:MAG: hypothetical protein ABW168_22335 [Sedimenticola sp.]